MTINAKPILEDKFWIVEEAGEKVGTISKNDEGFIFSNKGKITFHSDASDLTKKFGPSFLTAKVIAPEEQKDFSVHGFPTRTTPYNSMFDIQNKLPLFTKSEKSKSLYAAGYYIIRFEKGWVKSFCPKLITIQRYEFKGPFKDDLHMRLELSNANKHSS